MHERPPDKWFAWWEVFLEGMAVGLAENVGRTCGGATLLSVVSFVTQRGGCAKTTSAVNVAYLLGRRGYRVLCIDLDPQGHLAKGLGVKLGHDEPCLFRVLKGEASIEDIKKQGSGVDIWPSSREMFDFERYSIPIMSSEWLLDTLIREHRPQYDVVIIDNQPALSRLVINSLVASDWYIVPVFPESWSLDGLKEVQHTANQLSLLLNSEEKTVRLNFLGLFLANVDMRTNSAQLVRDVLAEVYPESELFKTAIPRGVAVPESIIASMPVCEFRPTSRPAVAYEELTQEIVERMGLS